MKFLFFYFLSFYLSFLECSWNILSSSSTTTIIGVNTILEGSSLSATSLISIGASVQRYNGKYFKYDSSILGPLLFDVAGYDNITITVGLTTIYISRDGGLSYRPVTNLLSYSQSVHIFGNGNYFGAVGTFSTPKTSSVDGVAVSLDSGYTWKISQVPIGNVRYGAFPSENTWYVTSGYWQSLYKSNELSRGISISSETGIVSFLFQLRSNPAWGAISKTTNGGQTWTTVFKSEQNKNYYFNSIDCSSVNHCVAVTEGSEYSHLHAFVTFDGGLTWNDAFQNYGSDTLPSNTVSLMCTSWVNMGDNVLEGWIAGASMDYLGRITGLFFHTTDGGITYTLHQTLDNCFPMDMDFASSKFGVVSCVTSSGLTSMIAVYQ